MKVFTSCSDNYVAVYDRFYESYCSSGLNPDDLKVDRWAMPEGKNGFKTANWYRALKTKMDFFKRELSKLAMEDVALFIDCDIQLFPNAPAAISAIQGTMLNKDLTFMFMKEGDRDEVNGGLFFARNNRASRLVLNVVCSELAKEPPPEYGEQTVFNRLLRNSCFRWDYVPYQYVIWAKNVHDKCHEVAFHHAVCSHSVESKLLQMREVADIVSQRYMAHTTQMASREASHQIVVCRWDEPQSAFEDGDWVGDHTVIYNKNEHESLDAFTPSQSRVVSLPNVGRAPHAFLYHIHENYDNLAEVTVFASGGGDGAFPGSPHLPIDAYVSTNTFCALVYSVGQGFTNTDRWAQGEDVGYGYVSDGSVLDKLKNKRMQATHLSIGEFYDKHVSSERPDVGRCVTLGSSPFSVARDVIHKKPKEYYLGLLQLLECHSDPEIAHYFEKCWFHMFMGPHCPDHLAKPASGFWSVTDTPDRVNA